MSGDLSGPAKPYSKETQAGKPKERKVPSAARQRQMRDNRQGPCRLCGSPPPNNLHHLIARSWGLAAWSESNLVPLCGSGTTGCHGLIEARDPDACRRLAAALTDREYAYVVTHYGETFFENRLGVIYTRA